MKANEIMTSAKRTFSKVGFGLQKKSPEILVGVGIVGAVASAVLACKATTKAGAIVEESKNSLADIRKAKENGVTVVSIVLFGEAGRIGTRKNAGSKVSYQRYYDDPRRDDRRNYNQRPRPVAGFEFDDIIFDNRGDADLVLDQLESAIANYGMASVLDLYDLAGLTCQNYMADKYGWTDIQSARVARTRDGYILQLPRAIQIT